MATILTFNQNDISDVNPTLLKQELRAALGAVVIPTIDKQTRGGLSILITIRKRDGMQWSLADEAIVNDIIATHDATGQTSGDKTREDRAAAAARVEGMTRSEFLALANGAKWAAVADVLLSGARLQPDTRE